MLRALSYYNPPSTSSPARSDASSWVVHGWLIFDPPPCCSLLQELLWCPLSTSPRAFLDFELGSLVLLRRNLGMLLLLVAFFVLLQGECNFWKKLPSLSAAPEPLALWDKELEGPSFVVFFFLVLWSVQPPSLLLCCQRSRRVFMLSWILKKVLDEGYLLQPPSLFRVLSKKEFGRV